VFALASSWFTVFVFTYFMSVFLWVDYDLYWVVPRFFGDGMFWLVLFITVAIPLLLEVACRYTMQTLRPSYTQILQEKVIGASAANRLEVINTPEDDNKWASRKPGNKRQAQNEKTSAALKGLTAENPSNESKQQTDALRSVLIRSMLRFRNLTGSQFDSAANHKYQQHDQPTPRHETKEHKG